MSVAQDVFLGGSVIAHCAERTELLSNDDWIRVQTSLKNPEDLPIYTSDRTPTPILLSGSSAQMLYEAWQGYKRVSGDFAQQDVGWSQLPPRMVGFFYLGDKHFVSEKHRANAHLIFAIKTKPDAYRVCICRSKEQVRSLLVRYQFVGFDKDVYHQHLDRAILDETNDAPLVTIGIGPSLIIAYHMCLWLDVNRLYGQTRRVNLGTQVSVLS